MTIERLSIQGFRGFLDRRELPMASGKRATSLCIFGDNGCGKSSVGDAVEFFFSPDGILSRLKKSQTENNAGISATRHALAAKKNIRTEVVFHFDGGKGFARSTNLAGAAGAIPDEIRALLEDAPVPLLMRSHEMRTFVADEKGAERYAILSRWVGLERLVAIQDALTKIEGKAKKWDKASAAKVAQLQNLDKLTERAVRQWDPPAIAKWLNEKLAKAGVAQKATKLEELERIDEELLALQQNEEDRSGISRYEAAGKMLDRFAPNDSPIARTIASSENNLGAMRELDQVRKRLTASELRPLWTAAIDYLSASGSSECPVCLRPFAGAASREEVLERLKKSLATISALETAESRARSTSQELKRNRDVLNSDLTRLDEQLQSCNDKEFAAAIGVIASLQATLSQLESDTPESWNASLVSSAKGLVAGLNAARTRSAEEAKRLQERLSIPFGDLRLAVKQLITIRDGWNRANREETALLEVTAQLQAVAEFIRAEVRAHVKSVLTALEADVRAIYGSLRGNDDHIPVIDIVVAQDKKSMRVALSLFGVDRVPPSGYLSDSQLNSLGLALYLAAVRRFNTGFRFLVLDDLMSSYDASHRLALVEVLAKYLTGFQVIVTTHDRAFFREIRAILADGGNWQFKQLKPWIFETGVRIDEDLQVDDDIERRLRDGEKPEIVAQLIMGNVEDWLLKICCDRGIAVPMKIRRDGVPAEPTMGTLWSSGQKVFEDHHKKHPAYPTLLGHSLLNWPRHAASAGELGITSGELETFWKQFKAFRDDFAAGSGSSAP
jgi:DNA repair exonuclease SbcCD ATPase subunit